MQIRHPKFRLQKRLQNVEKNLLVSFIIRTREKFHLHINLSYLIKTKAEHSQIFISTHRMHHNCVSYIQSTFTSHFHSSVTITAHFDILKARG